MIFKFKFNLYFCLNKLSNLVRAYAWARFYLRNEKMFELIFIAIFLILGISVIKYRYEKDIREINSEYEQRYERRHKEINIKNLGQKIIILTGTVGAGKTTFANSLKEYLESIGKKIYLPQEVTIEHENELSEYRTSLKDAIVKDENVEYIHVLFQKRVIGWYIDRMREISDIIDSYDYVLLDQTHLDTKIFTVLSVRTPFFVDFLNDKLRDIIFPSGILYVVYLNPGLENVLERQQKRGRLYEDDIEYYKELYNMYDANIRDIYPHLQEFNNSCSIDEYEEYFKEQMILL